MQEKTDFVACESQKHRPACATLQSAQRFCFLLHANLLHTEFQKSSHENSLSHNNIIHRRLCVPHSRSHWTQWGPIIASRVRSVSEFLRKPKATCYFPVCVCVWGGSSPSFPPSGSPLGQSSYLHVQIILQWIKIFQYCTSPAGRVTYNFHLSCKHMHLSFKSICNKEHKGVICNMTSSSNSSQSTHPVGRITCPF